MDDRPMPQAAATAAKSRLQTVDPATGQPGKAYDGHTVDEAIAIAARTRAAFEVAAHRDSPSGGV